MVKSITCITVDGHKITVPLIENISAVVIEMQGIDVVIKSPTKMRGARVITQVALNKVADVSKGTTVSLTACDLTEDSVAKWSTDAQMYITDNGRIMGRSITGDLDGPSKPLAVKPWINYSLQDKEDNANE